MMCIIGKHQDRYYYYTKSNINISISNAPTIENIVEISTLPTLFNIKNVNTTKIFYVIFENDVDYLVFDDYHNKYFIIDKKIMNRNKNFFISYIETNIKNLDEYFRKNN